MAAAAHPLIEYAHDIDQAGIQAFASLEKVKHLGEGGFGHVYLYKERTSGKFVAIKSVPKKEKISYKDGIEISAIKELQVMRELDHPNIIRLHDVVPYRGQIHMVLEYCVGDLLSVIKNASKKQLTEAHAKSITIMMLRAVAHCHERWFLHRDIKPENFLFAENGVLKLADFGHATQFGDDDDGKVLFDEVVTIWYRPPELLFGAKNYSTKIDAWSIGCTVAEVLLRRPLFAIPTNEEDEETKQLQQIFRLRGTPTNETWPDVDSLPKYQEFQEKEPVQWTKILPHLPSEAHDFLDRLLCLNPRDRMGVVEALQHPWLTETEPYPAYPSSIPLP